jgi:hypothetical protein
MQALPSTPQFEIHPSSFGIALLLATALALLAVLVVVTVLLAAGKSIVPWQRVKVAAAMMALIAPALLLVGSIALVPHAGHSQRSPAQRIVQPTGQDVKMAMRSTTTERKANDDAFTADAAPKPGVQTPSPKIVKTTVESGEESATIVEVEDVPEEQRLRAEAEHSAPAVSAAPPSDSPEEAARRERAKQRAEQRSALNTSGATIDDHVPSVTEIRARLTGVLHVRQTSSTAPDWCEKGAVPSGDGILVAVSSERFATLDEAERQVTQKAVGCVKDFFKDEYPLSGDWTFPVSLIEQNGVSNFVGEVFDKDFGNGVTGRMYRAHLRLNMNSALRKALHRSWDNEIVSHRLMGLGGILGLATLTLASFAGYLRLDDLTNGQFRGRLKIAAASLISAGGLVAWRLLA